ncbi:MAG: Rid family hydrolase [Devosia sp.]
MAHRRIRKFNTRDVYPGGELDNDMCWGVRAGQRIFLRGVTGFDFDQTLVGHGDPATQADVAMKNAAVLLEELGSKLGDVCKVTTYLTDRAYRPEVYATVEKHLAGIPRAGTGLVVNALALPHMDVEIDIEAVVPADPAKDHERIRPLSTRNWYGQGFDWTTCMVVKTQDEIYLRGQTGSKLDGSGMASTGYAAEDAAAQMELALQNARFLLEEAGSGFEDVCKLRVYIADRAYREAVYPVLGRHFGDVHPASTGLIVRAFARPEILVEVDMAVVLSKGTPHQRFRKFQTRDWYPDNQKLDARFCMAVRAGDRIFLRGQTGHTLDGTFVGNGDPAAQANQAMENVRTLLEEAGGSMSDICKVTTYLTDRAFRTPVYRAVGEHLRGVFPVGTGLVVDGLAAPEMLVEIDVEAVVA